jgi:competence protein ComEC
MYWSERPFVRIFLFFTAGIYLSLKIDLFRNTSPLALAGIVLLLLIVAFMLLPKRLPYRWHWIKGVVLGLALMFTGALVTTVHYPRQKLNMNPVKGTFLGVVNSQPAETEKTVKVKVKLLKEVDSSTIVLPANVLLYFEKDTINRLRYGDEVLFAATLKVPDKPANPEEFDYGVFLKVRGIAFVGFVPGGSFRIVGNNPPSRLVGFAIRLRQKILKSLRANGLSGNEYAVAAAIVLGYDEVMDDAIRQNYQRAGAMHVLCVSGLHVGVIYLVMMTLLQFLNTSKRRKILKAVLLLLSVWMYALLTGLAPSVMRATVMISFIIVGNEVERDKDAYNTLAMSALFLLLYNPGFLFDVGFQLSYAAVLGIVTFYRPVYRLLYFKNGLLNKAWAATAVSVAAQLGAFPVAAHYFHFLPTWFLVSNLIVMLLSTVIISTGLLFIVVSSIPLVSGWVALVLSGLIYLMNYLIEWVGKLPWSGVDDIYFPWVKVTLVYLLLLFGYRLFLKKEHNFVIPLLSTVLLLILFQVVHRFETETQSKIVVYDVGSKHEAVDFISGKNHVLLCDSALLKATGTLRYATENYRIKRGLNSKGASFNSYKNDGVTGLWNQGDFFVFNGVSIVRIKSNHFVPLSKPLPVDWLLISGNRTPDVKKLQQTFSFKKVILEPSVYKCNAKVITETFAKRGVTVYSVGQNGAFVFNTGSGGSILSCIDK